LIMGGLATPASGVVGQKCTKIGQKNQKHSAVCARVDGKLVWVGRGSKTNTAAKSDSKGASASSNVMWAHTAAGWAPSSKPPECTTEQFASPADLSLAESRLVPGQWRGDRGNPENYKVSGGLGFAQSTRGLVDVRVPVDAWIYQASRYTAGGELQIGFDLVVPCGWVIRIDHLAEVTPTISNLLNSLPPPREDDSRVTPITPVKIPAGTVVATKVGLPSQSNYFFQYGLFDVRKQNNAARAGGKFRSDFASRSEWAYHGVCWFDLLPDSQRGVARAWPSRSGDLTSDYCTS
jgi:hypothetical protein